MRQSNDNGRALARVRIFFLVLSVALGALDALNARHAINPDGISYLDMGEAYLGGDWGAAVNGLWSPLYSWLLGLALVVVRPSAYWQMPLVHLVNFLVYLWALWCFDFLLRELLRWRRARPTTDLEDATGALPEWASAALLYAVFLRASLSLNGLAAVTPDMCAASFVYLSSAFMLRIRGGDLSRRAFLMLGAMLGLSYLSKASMLPFAVVLLLASAVCAHNLRSAATRATLAACAFLLVGGLYFVPLSVMKGRVTFGDSARLNYVWYVNKTRLHVHWRGEPEGSGTALHPTRKILSEPPVYEFRTPLRATYPPWYDPSYWYEGARVRLDLAAQARVLGANAKTLYRLLFDTAQVVLCVVFLALYLWGWRRGARLKDALASVWTLVVPSIVMLSLLTLVHVEARYTGAFFVLTWCALVSVLRLPRRAMRGRIVSVVAVVLLCALMLSKVFASSNAAARAVWMDWTRGEDATRREHWEVSEALRRLGVREGDEVASVGYAFDALWARLARVRIVAEVTSGSLEAPTGDADRFWASDEQARRKVYELFAANGARVVVANRVPVGASTDGWQRIGATNFYVYLLDASLRPAH